MKKMVNGQIIEMTAEEIAEMEAMMEQIEQTPAEPTPEERIASLEEELKAAKILLGLEDA